MTDAPSLPSLSILMLSPVSIARVQKPAQSSASAAAARIEPLVLEHDASLAAVPAPELAPAGDPPIGRARQGGSPPAPRNPGRTRGPRAGGAAVPDGRHPGAVTLVGETLPQGAASDDDPAPAPLRPWVLHYLAKRTRVRIDKARELLGYQPVFGLEDGMHLTERWARWAGLLS
jgi:hypothetical protein